MRNLILGICSMVFGVMMSHLSAQTTLQTGDIAIISFNTDDPDQFSFVPLVDLSTGTQIKFTDNGWNGTALSSSEGTFTWTASIAYAKGSVISLNPSSISLSTSGDQLFAYQGNASAPQFIFGLSTNNWVTGSITSSTSRKPAALTTGISALAFSSEMDNGYFNITNNTGTRSELLALIANASNWNRSNSRYNSLPTWTFTFPVVNPEPAAQPSNLTFSGVNTYQGSFSFSPASPSPEGYIVLRSENAPLNTLPVDGSQYSIGEQIGNGKVVSIGNTSSFQQKAWRASTTYYITVLSYIYNGSSINYKQAAPLTASVTTPASMMGSYYANINTSSVSFVSDVQGKIRSPYTRVLYDQYDETMVSQFEFHDTTNAQKVQQCAYSGELYAYTPPFVWYTSSPFSREHTWCVSWMPSGGSTGLFEYADQHHLFTINQSKANTIRSNHPLGDVVTPTNTYLEGQLGYNLTGQLVYEPRDEHKGDAARAMLYMALKYHGINGYNWTFDNLNNVILPGLNEAPQSVATLLAWHNNDLPDGYEIARNDFIQSIQQNRNPFVDYPEWTNLIDFNTLTKQGSSSKLATTSSENSLERKTLYVYPNPSEGNAYVSLPETDTDFSLRVMNLMGQVVLQQTISKTGSQVAQLRLDFLSSGSYLIELSSVNTYYVAKWLKK